MATEYVRGVPQLQSRLRAISPARSGDAIMRRLALSTVREAKLLVPRKTGNLGRSIHVAAVTPSSATVEASAKYAGYVEFGTRAHEITPKARKALRWAASPEGRRLTGSPRVGAAVLFATRVHHPGTKPEPYLLPGAKKAVSASGLADQIVADWNAAA